MDNSWEDLLEEADEISNDNISMSSKRTYASGIRVYESVLSKHDIFP